MQLKLKPSSDDVEPGDFQETAENFEFLKTCDTSPNPKLPFGEPVRKSVQSVTKGLILPSSATVEEALIGVKQVDAHKLHPQLLDSEIKARLGAAISKNADKDVRALETLRWQCQVMLQRIHILERVVYTNGGSVINHNDVSQILLTKDSLFGNGLLDMNQSTFQAEVTGSETQDVEEQPETSTVQSPQSPQSPKNVTFNRDSVANQSLAEGENGQLETAGRLSSARNEQKVADGERRVSRRSIRKSRTSSILQTQIPVDGKRMTQKRAKKIIQESMVLDTNSGMVGDDEHWRKALVKRKVRAVENVLSVTIEDINSTIDQLARVYEQQDSLFMDMMHGRSAVVLQRIIRGFLIRARYRKAQDALRTFRIATGTKLIHRGVFYDINRTKRIEQHIKKTTFDRAHKILTRTLDAWRDAVETLRPLRQHQMEQTERMRKRILRRLLSERFLGWAEISNGPHSRKALKESYELRFMECRERLLDRELQKPMADQMTVTKTVILEEMYRDITRRVRAIQYRNIQDKVFAGWRDAVLSTYFLQKDLAHQHWAKHIIPRLFVAWRRFLKMRENEAYVNQAWVRESFIPVQNMRQVMNFHRKAVLTRYFPRWKHFTWKLKQLRQRLRRFQINRLGLYFRAWKVQASFQHQVRALCIQEWKAFGSRIRRVPFRAWYLWMKDRKTTRETQEILLKAYHRRKRRIATAGALRLWKHQVLYGKTGGGSNRVELIRAIETQKQRAVALEDAMEQQSITLQHVNSVLEAERKITAELQQNMHEKHERLMTLQFAKHHVEQEVVRLQSMMDAVSMIHPGTISRLMAMDSSDQLQDTGIGTAVQNSTFVTSKLVGKIPGVANLPRDVDPSRPSSARSRRSSFASLHEEAEGDEWDEAPPLTRQRSRRRSSGIEKPSDLVWLKQEDADIVLRGEYVKKLLHDEFFGGSGKHLQPKGLGTRRNRRASSEGRHKGTLVLPKEPSDSSKESAMENDIPTATEEEKSKNVDDKTSERLRALLLFVLFGGSDVIAGLVNPIAPANAEEGEAEDKLTKEESESTDTQVENEEQMILRKKNEAHVSRRKRQQQAIDRIMLHDDENWNDFVQKISRKFPLIHQLHRTPKDGVTRRIVKLKEKAKDKTGRPQESLHILATIDTVTQKAPT